MIRKVEEWWQREGDWAESLEILIRTIVAYVASMILLVGNFITAGKVLLVPYVAIWAFNSFVIMCVKMDKVRSEYDGHLIIYGNVIDATTIVHFPIIPIIMGYKVILKLRR